MENNPLDEVFETPEQSLAHYLNAMPKSLVSVFQREFVRRPTKRAVDAAQVCGLDGGEHDWKGNTCMKCRGHRQ